MPELVWQNRDDASKQLSGLKIQPVVIGDGKTIRSQAISAGEKQAVFSDIISAARSREMVSSPDLQTFSQFVLVCLFLLWRKK